MINISNILERAWRILWNYRTLWIFGVLLAITMGTSGGGSSGYQFSGDEFEWNGRPTTPEIHEFQRWLDHEIRPLFQNPEAHLTTIIWAVVGFVLFILLIATIMTVIRYVSETAVLRMVNDNDATGAKVKFSQGWKMGWSRPAFRLWVIDLILSIPGIFFGLFLLFSIGLGIYTALGGIGDEPSPFGILSAVAIFFFFVLLLIIVQVFLGLLRQFFSRKAALDNANIGNAIRDGWKMFMVHWKSAGLLWLVMVGLGIGAGVVSFFLFFLFIPFYIIMLIPALLVAGIPGLIAFGITSLFTSGPLTWIIGLLFALPLYFITLFLPLSFITGLYRIFTSSVWTLAYRDMQSLEAVSADLSPVSTQEEE